MQLWNIHTEKMLYEFSNFGSAIRCLAQSPAVDVVAIGLDDGRIILHNILYDETISTFRHHNGSVNCLDFRTDGRHLLASGSSSGCVAIWDLSSKQIQSTIDAHVEGVCGLRFLPGEPVLVSSGADNAIRMWIFDQGQEQGANVPPRLLRSRSGHHEPPCKLKFYGKLLGLIRFFFFLYCILYLFFFFFFFLPSIVIEINYI